MIPLKDIDHPTARVPVVTYGFVALNVLVFFAVAEDLDGAARGFGAVANHFTGLDAEPVVGVGADGRTVVVAPVPRSGPWPLRALTHMWVHGSLMHLLGNIWFLHVFGDNVEDRIGRARFVGFYLACGAAALVAQVVAGPASGLPMVGASGAIAGVLGAYFRLFPRARVLTLIPLGFLLTTVVWPAYAFLGIWMGIQLLSAWSEVGAGAGGGVAWWAHIGGFVAGWLLVGVFEPQPPQAAGRASAARR
ncbi:MAG: rhomboid family intramembrane serine protease [Planctomycetota bacterium]